MNQSASSNLNLQHLRFHERHIEKKREVGGIPGGGIEMSATCSELGGGFDGRSRMPDCTREEGAKEEMLGHGFGGGKKRGMESGFSLSDWAAFKGCKF